MLSSLVGLVLATPLLISNPLDGGVSAVPESWVRAEVRPPHPTPNLFILRPPDAGVTLQVWTSPDAGTCIATVAVDAPAAKLDSPFPFPVVLLAGAGYVVTEVSPTAIKVQTSIPEAPEGTLHLPRTLPPRFTEPTGPWLHWKSCHETPRLWSKPQADAETYALPRSVRFYSVKRVKPGWSQVVVNPGWGLGMSGYFKGEPPCSEEIEPEPN